MLVVTPAVVQLYNMPDLLLLAEVTCSLPNDRNWGGAAFVNGSYMVLWSRVCSHSAGQRQW